MNIQQLEAELTKVRGELTAALERNTQLEAQLKQANETRDKGSELLTAANQELASVKAENATLKASVDKLTAEAKTAEVRAAEIVANAGHTAVVASTEGAKVAGEENVFAQFAAITDPVKRGEFYLKNREKLLGA